MPLNTKSAIYEPPSINFDNVKTSLYSKACIYLFDRIRVIFLCVSFRVYSDGVTLLIKCNLPLSK